MTARSADGRRSATREHGRAFWVGLALGWAVTAYGLWIVVANVRETRPLNFGVFFLGLLVVHDLVIAPATLALAFALRERLPRVARAAAAGAIVATVLAVAFVVPAAIGRDTKLADNPTIVPRDPWASAAIVVAAVWIVAGAVVLRRVLPGGPASESEDG